MKSLKLFILLLLILFIIPNENAHAKVMWGKMELVKGQIGKATILKNTELWYLEADETLTLSRNLKKGEEYRIYRFKSIQGGLYGVGGGYYIKKSSNVKYETPSKSKVAALDKEEKAKLENGPTTNAIYKSNQFYANFNKLSKDGWSVPEGTTTKKVQSALGKPNQINDLSDVGYPGIIQWVYAITMTNSDGTPMGTGSMLTYHTIYFLYGKVVHPNIY